MGGSRARLMSALLNQLVTWERDRPLPDGGSVIWLSRFRSFAEVVEESLRFRIWDLQMRLVMVAKSIRTAYEALWPATTRLDTGIPIADAKILASERGFMPQQSDLVVMVQRADGDARNSRKLPDREFFHEPGALSASNASRHRCISSGTNRG